MSLNKEEREAAIRCMEAWPVGANGHRWGLAPMAEYQAVYASKYHLEAQAKYG